MAFASGDRVVGSHAGPCRGAGGAGGLRRSDLEPTADALRSILHVIACYARRT